MVSEPQMDFRTLKLRALLCGSCGSQSAPAKCTVLCENEVGTCQVWKQFSPGLACLPPGQGVKNAVCVSREEFWQAGEQMRPKRCGNLITHGATVLSSRGSERRGPREGRKESSCSRPHFHVQMSHPGNQAFLSLGIPSLSSALPRTLHPALTSIF